MTPDLDAAVAPVADALDALGIPYYLAGSVISSLHGVARATADVDLVAALAGKDAVPLVDRLGDDYYADLDAVRDAIGRRAMFNVIHQPTMLKVDVYVCASDFDRSALARRVVDTLLAEPGARRFSIATAEDIVLHKLHWFRIGGGSSDRQWGRAGRPAHPARDRSRVPPHLGRPPRRARPARTRAGRGRRLRS